MTLEEVMRELESFGNSATKNTLMKHGAREPFFGVRVGDMKKIVKKVKKDHDLALKLYETGNSDAMYLAGLIADEKKITKEQLQQWVEKAYWYMLSEYTVAWIAADSEHGYDMGLKWIESTDEKICTAGWAALGNVVTVRPNEELNIGEIEKLLERVGASIHDAPNRVRYTMNGFVICVGSSIPDLTEKSISISEKIGKVSVNMGGTACKVPDATSYIKKISNMGRIGKKRKMARC